MKKVAVAMSGGVDSSVTAALLKEQGFDVIGITGKMVNSQAANLVCENAKAVAEKLQIPHFILDVSEQFKQKVIDYFNKSYLNSETPNPCAMCNKCIKWGEIFNYAINDLGCDYFATGHYANIKKNRELLYNVSRKRPQKRPIILFISSNTRTIFKNSISFMRL